MELSTALEKDQGTQHRLCKEAGGVAIKDYKGAFGVCLNPSAVIKVE